MRRFMKVLEYLLVAAGCPLFFGYVLPWMEEWSGLSRKTIIFSFVIGGVLGLIGISKSSK